MSRVVGLRHYEMTDHLGNVLATVLDRKTGAGGNGIGTLYDHWHADVSNATDYYPFGMQMPGRVKNMDGSNGYKFGFNGQMKDNEIAGTGNHVDFGARGYDPRLGKWWSRDPLATKYPSTSPYVYSGNSPIVFGDYDGRDFGVIINSEGRNRSIIVVATIYTVSAKATIQAQAAADMWNAKSAVVDGYTVSFQVKVEQAPTASREEIVNSSKTIFNRNGSINESLVANKQLAVAANNAYVLSSNDPVGNVYNGNYGGKIVGQDRQDYIGGVTAPGGKSITMNTHQAQYMGDESRGDLGQYSDLVGHEIGHLFGQDDEGKPYFSPDGIMKYVNEGSQNPISDADVSSVIRYAHDTFNGANSNDAKVKIVEKRGTNPGPVTTP